MNATSHSDSITVGADGVRALEWTAQGLRMLDQRRLPGEEQYLLLQTAPEVARAISDMVVRGAPAIGIAAAYGMALSARTHYRPGAEQWRQLMADDRACLAAARPTAVNLAWALARMDTVWQGECSDPPAALLREARAIHQADVGANRAMGRLGARRLMSAEGVLTHCNTGSLATGGYGTALGVVRRAWSQGHLGRVFATETRPWLQGTRLTAWELARDGIPVTLIGDGAAAALMASGQVGWVVVGADRIAANGDVANKIGTYALALAARHHGVGFMVVAPTSTIDPHLATGSDISLENRPAEELLGLAGRSLAPPGAQAWNPVFDITPASLVTALVTEKGIAEPPDAGAIADLLQG